MNLILIAAVSENNVIGLNGKVPWYIPEDLKRFKQITSGHPVIMGRKTHESIGTLSNRENIVLSDTLNVNNGVYVVKSVGEVICLFGNKNSYIIGGEKIYNKFLPLANHLELTRVFKRCEGDAFFPSIDWTEWKSIYDSGIKLEKGLEYSFSTYKRISIDQQA